MKVLIADDTASDRIVLKSYLKKMNHQVVETANGEEALEEILNNYCSYDLMIIDVLMPVMDGHEFARRIRAHEGEEWLPLIFLSGKTGDEDLAAGIDAGGDDYLFKPINRTILKAKINAMGRISALRNRLAESNRKLGRLVNQDGLTGAANRRYLDQYLEIEFLRARRNMQPLSLCMIDVDRFKKYNDSFGHQQGDECLKNTVSTISNCIHRPADLVARYGGEEFCCVLPETPLNAAFSLAEKIRSAVEESFRDS
ncbi:MAG: diguanylate cyclase, partial [Spirochaetales bacterium]|nr:diguanylate cyclase [Spirochaetales bacterium]